MTDKTDASAPPARRSIFSPLGHPLFRRIWFASLTSNLGLMVMGVGAAWAMTEMTNSPEMVALVQASLMLPVALVSAPAGAAADMFDRRIVSLIALTISFAGACALTLLAWYGALSPAMLLGFGFLIGCGMALMGPSWQASVSEQVPSDDLPAAVALNGISWNLARSFGPAVGGAIVAAFGATAAFANNALFYLPLMIVLFMWRRERAPSRLPPERLGRAVVSGVRYIAYSLPIRIVLVRTMATGVLGGAILALMPVVARDLLNGDARDFGIMLGAFGVGAVIGALNVSNLSSQLGAERAIRLAAMTMGAGVAIVAISHSKLISGLALLAVGAGWTASVTLFNVGIQLVAPRWVSGRALAAFQASISGGVAVGAWFWGATAKAIGVSDALLVAGFLLAFSAILGRWMRMPQVKGPTEQTLEELEDPEIRLQLTPRSGPIVVEIEYRVEPKQARLFYALMQQVQSSRQRNGAYGWSIARDIADPELWTERYHCPTWLDYLRQRNRPTDIERALHARALEFHVGPEPVRIRRMLERPVGSVRWKEDTPDRVVAAPAAMVGM
ncbi:MAG TPA: MFS transporter [Rhodoblastus sp.]|nr:MFS transporter [Rhodoblastus sp.]